MIEGRSLAVDISNSCINPNKVANFIPLTGLHLRASIATRYRALSKSTVSLFKNTRSTSPPASNPRPPRPLLFSQLWSSHLLWIFWRSLFSESWRIAVERSTASGESL
ncbi:unnamed protein product [Linum trigynum]|uniref:Uncharacterized protein n=1 Tax=Linum trigynum TaxID=586398 RepID=A0AAV2CJR9_9ROSI